MKSKDKHIDDVQPSTVDEHLEALLKDEEPIDYDGSKEVTPTDLPEWYDEELFKQGQQYYIDNSFGIATAGLCGLIAVLAIPSILKILIYTKQSGTSCTAFRRYLQTTLHARLWYIMSSQDKDSDWYKSINTVRWKHCISSRRALRDGLGGITHRDMALTQFGFLGYVLLCHEELGLTNTPKQREGINHFWRVLGHIIGISDRLNICRKSEAETTELCSKLRSQVFVKYFEELPENFIEMTEVMLDGTWSIDMAVDKDAFLTFTYKLTGVPYNKPLGLYSRLNLAYRKTVHKLCGIPYMGKIVREYFNYLIPLNMWVLENWPIVAWLRYGQEKSKITMFSKLK